MHLRDRRFVFCDFLGYVMGKLEERLKAENAIYKTQVLKLKRENKKLIDFVIKMNGQAMRFIAGE